MNQINQTTLEQMNVKMPNEPCSIVQLAKRIAFSDAENCVNLKVSGDRFNGTISVKYNEGTDLYDVSFWKFKNYEGRVVKEIFDLDCEQLPEVLWNEVFIV